MAFVGDRLSARARVVVASLLFAVAYYGLSELGLALMARPEQAAVVWPASGLALAAVVLVQRRHWPAILALVFGANLLAQLLSRGSEPLSVGLAGVNTFETLVAASLLLAVSGHARRFVYGSTRGVAGLLAAAGIGAGLGAVAGGGLLHLAVDAPLASSIATWWLADALGMLAVAPLVLAWADRRRPAFRLEELALLAAVVLTTLAIAYPDVSGVPQALAQAFVLLPVLVWTAVRAQPRIASIATILLIGILTQAAVTRGGPFSAGVADLEGIETLQVFLIVAAVLVVLVEAILATRRVTERALAKTTESLRSVLTAATESAIVSVDLDGRIVLFNPGAERILGFTSEEMLGEVPTRYLDPDEISSRAAELGLEPGFEVIAHAARRGEAETRRWTAIRKDGRTLPLSLTITPRIDDEGRLVGFIGVAQDISATVRLESERAAVARSSRAVAEAGPLDETLDLIAREMGGLSTAKIAAVTRFESTELGTVLGAWSVSGRLPSGQPVNLCNDTAASRVSATGEECHLAAVPAGSAASSVDRAGAPVFVHGHLWGAVSVGAGSGDQLDVDVMPRLTRFADLVGLAVTNDEARREVERKRDELSAVIDGLPALVWVRDLSGKLLMANRGFADLLGGTPEDGSAEAIRGELFSPILDADAFSADSTITTEQDFTAPDGAVRTVLVARSPLKDDRGRVYALTCVATDITERRATERAKDEFVQIVSHELRTPLSSIRGALSLLSEEPSALDETARRRMVRIASTNSERLVMLVNDILDLQRIESGGTAIRPADCDSGDLVQRAVEAMGALAAERGVELVSSPAAFPVFVEDERVVQLLSNYLSNAIKFSPPGSRVEVGSLPRDGEAAFYVRDEGPGIPEEMLERIFDRFEQVDSSASRAVGGTGLGLTICRQIAELHDGRAWAESEVGVGSCFWFSVPLTLPASLPEPVTHDGKAILVCDDDAVARAETRTIVEAMGFDVLEAETGEQAVARAREDAPSTILLDLMMPGMDGFETLIRLSEDEATAAIPVVMMSSLPPDRVESPPRAVADWITKPASTDEIARALSLAHVPSQASRVLVVEDDFGLADVLLEQLHRDSIPAVHARTGRQAIEMATRVRPALIVLDVGLPDGDGFAVVEALRERNIAPHALVVYSALEFDEEERERLRLGRTDFFTKSRVSPTDFHRRLASMLPEVTAA